MVIIILALAITNVFQYIRTDKYIKKYHAEVEKNKSLTYANESLQRKYDFMTELKDFAMQDEEFYRKLYYKNRNK